MSHSDQRPADGGPSQAPAVSVVIPTRNRLPLLRYLFASLQSGHARPDDYEIVVVDDGSTDGTAEWLSRFRPWCAWTVIRHDSARGRGQARNAGWRAACGDVVLFLDADVLAPPSLVSAHRRAHERRPNPCCVTGYPWFWRDLRTWRFEEGATGPAGPILDPALVRDWPALERWAGAPLAPAWARPQAAPPDAAPFLWCVTRAISVRRPLLAELRGFCERFTGYGLEDWEFGYRLMRRGVEILSDPAATVFHQAHPPADRAPDDLYRNYGAFLDLHPESEVGLMPLIPPWSAPDSYARLFRAVTHARRAAPAWHGALEEAAVAFGRSWAESGGRPVPPMGWNSWAARWGQSRSRRILEEHAGLLGDAVVRPALVAFGRVVGLHPA